MSCSGIAREQFRDRIAILYGRKALGRGRRTAGWTARCVRGIVRSHLGDLWHKRAGTVWEDRVVNLSSTLFGLCDEVRSLLASLGGRTERSAGRLN